ncbi:hypothetical protein TGAM01_v207329 [Trichoderma gamsii]|uniref:Uncharacterized protein n=1 Tax=Trichoderma gamsii TaxID=398673 RepID=A0A2P4ZHB9_9HYPO|nr:hypothetical protein TGAM01_v207329 [Trichoderma gamsii]PON23682.1 hypothetical protein TGAM01_v207329 [Trichoderma gamsii]
MLPKWATHPAGGTMAIMLLFGAAFAIGHHFFYQSLSGNPPPNVVYFRSFAGGLTGQQFNLAVGSVFAFLVNSALGVAIHTAANQALWVAIRTKPSKLGVIDNLATATTNIWNVFDFRLWKSSPIRMTLITIFWILSVAFFITPATLNIKWSMTTSVSMTRVPQVDFTSLNFAEIQLEQSTSPDYRYYNPQYPVLQVVAESTAGGRILPISSPHQNATWVLNFPGPALSCKSLDNSSALYDNITNNILVTMSVGPREDQVRACAYSFGYISWVPEAEYGGSDINSLPFPGMSLSTNNTPYGPPSRGVGPIYASPAREPLTLFIAALPSMHFSNVDQHACTDYNSTSFSQSALDQVANMTITKCMMYNTSYVANFTYIDNIQSIELTTQGSFNNIIGQPGVAGANLVSYPEAGSDKISYNVSLVETFAYQAIMDAFGRMFVGTIAYDVSQQKQIIDTQMAMTPLLNTKEFNFIRPLSEKFSLQELLNGANGLWNGVSVEQAPNSTIPMAGVIEELFRNATISLISNPLFQPNYSSPYAPPDIDVAVTTYGLVYLYAARTLLLAYAIALGMTLLSILLGAISIYHNGGSSYTTKISTILRAAYCIDFSEPIRPEDTDGKDPTPRYIKKLTISFPPVGTAVRYNKAAQSSEGEQLQQI